MTHGYFKMHNALESMTHRYFKMHNVSYLIRILHRYQPDTPRYVSEEYLEINFIFLKKNCSILFRYIGDTRGIDGGKPIRDIYIFFYICNELGNNVLFLGYIIYVID